MARTLTEHAWATQHGGNYTEGTMIYHGTAVVEWDPEKIVLETGGYRTATTKERMNQAADVYGLGFRVYAKNREWFADFRGETIPFGGRTLTLDRVKATVRQG